MSTSALRIGLSARLLHQPPAELGFRGKTLQYLEQSIAHWVMIHGALVFMVPTIETGGDVARRTISVKSYVQALDGLVLQGGSDVSPQRYNEEPLRPEWRGDAVRDQYEIELFWEFVIQQKPVLGICRGAQLINVALGGSLYQDILTQHDGAIVHLNRALYDQHQHPIRLQPDSALARLYPGVTTPLVNSIHHQAVKQLGRDLLVEAVAEDGIIEAIRWRGSSYAVGIQWHPEFHGPDAELLDSTPILQDFLDACTAARG